MPYKIVGGRMENSPSHRPRVLTGFSGRRLVHFDDEDVGAVGGHLEIGRASTVRVRHVAGERDILPRPADGRVRFRPEILIASPTPPRPPGPLILVVGRSA